MGSALPKPEVAMPVVADPKWWYSELRLVGEEVEVHLCPLRCLPWHGLCVHQCAGWLSQDLRKVAVVEVREKTPGLPWAEVSAQAPSSSVARRLDMTVQKRSDARGTNTLA